MGSLEPDVEVAEAAERLHIGRLGHRFAKRALDIVLSAADRRLNATTGATRRRWGDTHAKGPGFIPRALGQTIGTSLDIMSTSANSAVRMATSRQTCLSKDSRELSRRENRRKHRCPISESPVMVMKQDLA